jgi:hypothetical protein
MWPRAGGPGAGSQSADRLPAGRRLGAARRGRLPTAAYLASRPDLVRAGLTPLEHWARRGVVGRR